MTPILKLSEEDFKVFFFCKSTLRIKGKNPEINAKIENINN